MKKKLNFIVFIITIFTFNTFSQNIDVTIDQKLSNSQQVGVLKKWGGSNWSNPFSPGSTFPFPQYSQQVILGDQTIHSAQKYNNWNGDLSDVKNLNEVKENMLTARVTGEFTCHGVTKEVYSDVTLTYLVENEMTKMKMPGDLLGVRAKFNIKLSDFGVQHMALGKKVADNIEINVNIIGSNKM